MTSTLVSTSLNSTILTSTITRNATVNVYDYEGAAIYIAVILVWYSTGLILMLFLQVRPRTYDSQFLLDYQSNDKSKSCSLHAFGNYHNVEADHIKKHILNELKDPDRRQRLWKIYYSSKEKQNEPHPRYYKTITADSATIGRINRKLADIHRIDARNRDESMLPSLDLSSTVNKFETTKFFNRRIASLRKENDVQTVNNREPLASQIDTKTTTKTEVKPVVCEQKPILSVMTVANGSRKRINKFSTRFTVEKVLENNNNSSAIQPTAE
ncbi:unnamed protein product [Rotaria magnacalcarata]|uniref:Uncharacterized protein n=3 Tax=Rotaria magnacalcarata TaxID=392030 RepID=A0A816AY91_9BILA|nr:unnamed protein product [Rotaria magnacalcarata]CAF1603674.1 unnamed protein product [Rotaria magnacalcarata]CAF2048112.1 unnamed protein product [Rotaria magnacalcarata]CAF2062630.1 unnamed protein product [Rotaria magnacalcarata]CAF3777611.1 unnamed protein product [Rotaria magnacalcarata]